MPYFFLQTKMSMLSNSFWQLVIFRFVVIIILSTLSIAGWMLDYPVSSWDTVVFVLLVLLTTNLVLFFLPDRLQTSQGMLALGCTLDFLAIFGLLWLSGGVSNGFIALLLLPVAVTAVLLPAWVSYIYSLAAIGWLLWTVTLAG